MCVCTSNSGCRRQLSKCSTDDPDTLVNTGCVLFKEGKFEVARQKFNEALSIIGYQVRLRMVSCKTLCLVIDGYLLIDSLPCCCSQPDLQYNIALCYYKTKQYGDSLRYLAEIIERGVREHPELSVGR